MLGHVCCAPQIYKARWGRNPAAAEFMVTDSAEQKKHENGPMLLKLKHPNVIDFFDYGEIATGEVGIYSIGSQASQRKAIAAYPQVLVCITLVGH